MSQVKVIKVLCPRGCTCRRCVWERWLRAQAIKPRDRARSIATEGMPHGKAMFILTSISAEITATIDAFRKN